MLKKITILDVLVKDIRFPTSKSLDGSDAMNPDPDYSAAYVIVKTDHPNNKEGHGLTFTIGRGNELCVEAIKSLSYLVIGKTLEYVKLPTHLAARIEGKSSLARLGLSVHITAPTIQAGWEGRIYLEMNNVGPFNIELRPKMEIAQLIIEHVGLPTRGKSEGRFWGQR